MEVVSDTSALISLEVGNILDKCLMIVEISIPKIVKTELTDVSKYADIHGKSASSVLSKINTGMISVQEVENDHQVKTILDMHKRIDEGEAASLVLCWEKNIKYLVTDDWRAYPHLKNASSDVNIVLSAFLIRALVTTKILSLQDAKKVISKIAESRDWLNSEMYKEVNRLFQSST
ncbi:MAG: hypothetical protein ACE5J9_04810 [Methanosarcinales archaeon]